MIPRPETELEREIRQYAIYRGITRFLVGLVILLGTVLIFVQIWIFLYGARP